MHCPQCRVEYLPHIRRCPDCDVSLVERRPATHGDSERTRVSGFDLFRAWGIFIVMPVLFVATMFVFIALRDNPFEVQIAWIIWYTGWVFLLVFCDVGSRSGKTTKGFSLGEKAVKQKLPLLLCIHAVSLVVLFAGVTEAMRLRPHSWSRWRPDFAYFDLICILTGTAIAFAQIHLFRRLLGRALKDEQGSRGS
jgi:hypothetical protein